MMLTLSLMPGPIEWTVIAVIALVLFGRRLPEVARSMGKSIVEFKKGLKDVKDSIDQADKPEALPKQGQDKPAQSDDH